MFDTLYDFAFNFNLSSLIKVSQELNEENKGVSRFSNHLEFQPCD